MTTSLISTSMWRFMLPVQIMKETAAILTNWLSTGCEFSYHINPITQYTTKLLLSKFTQKIKPLSFIYLTHEAVLKVLKQPV